jgi:hypothetical protein
MASHDLLQVPIHAPVVIDADYVGPDLLRQPRRPLLDS